jgi:hypothetical protein
MERRNSEPAYRALVVGIFLAVVAAMAGYIVSLFEDHRKREIEFVDQQIEKLYGPIFAVSTATRRAKDELLSKLRPGKSDYFAKNDPPGLEEVQTWRRWIQTVFQPMNLQMEKAIVDNAQLIEGGHIYPVFADLILHVESYKATIAKWKDTDANENSHFIEASENTSLIDFPKGFDRCVQLRFEAMRARRDSLKRSWIFFPVETPPENDLFPEDCR